MRISRRVSLFVLAACLVSGDAVAQSAPPEITITAGRRVQPIARAGSAITVVTAEEIAQSGATSAHDVLRGVPGVTVLESGGVGGTADVKLRGADERHTLVMIDGIRVNDPGSARNTFDFASFSVTDIERIEVLRGPQSALYGSDAIGGVIHIITRKGRGAARGAVSVEGGSYGTGVARASLSGGNDEVSAAVSAFVLTTDGYSRYRDGTEDDGTLKAAGSARLGYEPYDWLMIEAGVTGYHQESELDEIDSSPRDADDTSERQVVNGFVRGTVTGPGDRLRTTVTAYANQTDRDFFDDRTGDSSYSGRRLGAETQTEYGLGRFGTVIGGFVAEHEEAEIAEVDFLSRTNLIDASQSTLSAFALHEFSLGSRLHISLGGRVDHFGDAGTYATGRATAAFLIPETETKLRASVGSGAKAPTLYQRFHPQYGDPTLEVEESVGVDAGIDQVLFDGRLTVSATVFHNEFRNLIEFDSATSSYQNVSRARSSGIETSADVNIVPGKLRAHGAYTFLVTEDRDTGFELERRPDHAFEASLILTAIPKLTLEGRVIHVGERFNRSRERDLLDPYTRVDVLARYQATRNLAVTGRIENLFDADIEDPKDFAATGLAGYAGLAATF